jgi:uncharacterized repeat protein (TIGR03806 family)
VEWKNPLYVIPEPGGNKLWVVLQGGEKHRPSRIVSVENRPDVRETDTVLVLERRLLYGLTFHPGFATNRFVYVFSNGPTEAQDRTNRVSRFSVGTAASVCEPNSEKVILEWRSAGHDGGDLAFGKDGMLYITAGDGTSDSDTWDSGQDVSNLLATLIRIDVDDPFPGKAYRVPLDNPFANLKGARPEIWAYGFRNPWRMGIDERTGEIWVGQNGQDLWETAYLVERGANYGWSVYEGSHPFYPNRRRGPTPILPPTIEHHHSEFRSLTGGIVYYGEPLRDLNGAYVYGDYSTGKIWAARHRQGRLFWHVELVDTTLQIAAFRVDQRGDLLIVDHGGGLYRMVTRKVERGSEPFPTRLSETGLFVSVKEQTPARGVMAYGVNAPGWIDGASAQRFLALPGDTQIQFAESRGWNFTNGAVLVQTISMKREAGDSASERKIETRVLLKQEGEWAGYSYRWNEEQTDAALVRKEGQDIELRLDQTDGTVYTRAWHIPSRAECLACHSRAANFVLGLSSVQMNRDFESAGTTSNQIFRLATLGMLSGVTNQSSSSLGRLVNPYDESEEVEKRARSYLHANCSVCHVEAGGGNAQMELEITRDRDRMRLIEARPQHDTFGIVNAMLIAPGEPERSVLLHRLRRRGPGQMPPLGTRRVDEGGVSLIREWIARMKPEHTFVRDWTLADLLSGLETLSAGRAATAGKRLFREIGCAQCHRMAEEGGTVGPDLSGIGRRLNKELLLESIIEPSKVIAEPYATYEIERREGEPVTGRIEREDEREIVMRAGSALDELVRLRKEEVTGRRKHPVSNMPAGMVNVLTREQIYDLLAYLMTDREAAGDKLGPERE